MSLCYTNSAVGMRKPFFFCSLFRGRFSPESYRDPAISRVSYAKTRFAFDFRAPITLARAVKNVHAQECVARWAPINHVLWRINCWRCGHCFCDVLRFGESRSKHDSPSLLARPNARTTIGARKLRQSPRRSAKHTPRAVCRICSYNTQLTARFRMLVCHKYVRNRYFCSRNYSVAWRAFNVPGELWRRRRRRSRRGVWKRPSLGYVVRGRVTDRIRRASREFLGNATSLEDVFEKYNSMR